MAYEIYAVGLVTSVFLSKLLDSFYRHTMNLEYFSTEKSTATVGLNKRKPMDSGKGEEDA